MEFITEETDREASGCCSELVVKPSDVGMRPTLWDVSYPDPERKFQRKKEADHRAAELAQKAAK